MRNKIIVCLLCVLFFAAGMWLAFELDKRYFIHPPITPTPVQIYEAL